MSTVALPEPRGASALRGLTLVAVALIFASCGGGGSSAPSTASPVNAAAAMLSVSSPELSSGRFSRDLTCDGADRPPRVTWQQPPAGTGAVVVELLDPDAPGGAFVHWLLAGDGADPGAMQLPAPAGAFPEGRNGFGKSGYGGPCPPPGSTHHYLLSVSAYSAGLHLRAGFERAALDAAIAATAAHLLARGEVVATYGR